MSVLPCRRVLFRQRGQCVKREEMHEKEKQKSLSICLICVGEKQLTGWSFYILSSPFVYLGFSIECKYCKCVTQKIRICKINMNVS